MVSGASGGAQGHADSSRHPFTVKGQGGASCGLGLDDVAVRDLLNILRLSPVHRQSFHFGSREGTGLRCSAETGSHRQEEVPLKKNGSACKPTPRTPSRRDHGLARGGTRGGGARSPAFGTISVGRARLRYLAHWRQRHEPFLACKFVAFRDSPSYGDGEHRCHTALRTGNHVALLNLHGGALLHREPLAPGDRCTGSEALSYYEPGAARGSARRVERHAVVPAV